MADVTGMTEWLAERVTEAKMETGDTAIVLENEVGKFAIIVPLDAEVYLVTVQEARFIPAPVDEPPTGEAHGDGSGHALSPPVEGYSASCTDQVDEPPTEGLA